MIECHYEINISLSGLHFCRVVLPAGLTREQAIARSQTLKTRMGRPYKCSLAWIECHGEEVAI